MARATRTRGRRGRSRGSLRDLARGAGDHVQPARRQARFLAAIVKAPSDNPPGDCAPHAARAAALLEEHGFTVERFPINEAEDADETLRLKYRYLDLRRASVADALKMRSRITTAARRVMAGSLSMRASSSFPKGPAANPSDSLMRHAH